MKLNYFKEYFLTPGSSVDNCIFHNCQTEFMKFAEQEIRSNLSEINPCILTFTKQDTKKLEKILDQCADNSKRDIIAKNYFCSRFLLEFLRSHNLINIRGYSQEILMEGIRAIESADFLGYFKMRVHYPSGDEIGSLVNWGYKTELDIFLYDMDNIFLQQSINDFIYSREPYGIKLFTNQKKLVSYATTSKRTMTCTCDYFNIAPPALKFEKPLSQ